MSRMLFHPPSRLGSVVADVACSPLDDDSLRLRHGSPKNVGRHQHSQRGRPADQLRPFWVLGRHAYPRGASLLASVSACIIVPLLATARVDASCQSSLHAITSLVNSLQPQTRRVTNQFKMFDLRRSATQLYDFGTQSSATTTTTKYKKGSYHRGRYFASGEDGVVKVCLPDPVTSRGAEGCPLSFSFADPYSPSFSLPDLGHAQTACSMPRGPHRACFRSLVPCLSD